MYVDESNPIPPVITCPVAASQNVIDLIAVARFMHGSRLWTGYGGWNATATGATVEIHYT